MIEYLQGALTVSAMLAKVFCDDQWAEMFIKNLLFYVCNSEECQLFLCCGALLQFYRIKSNPDRHVDNINHIAYICCKLCTITDYRVVVVKNLWWRTLYSLLNSTFTTRQKIGKANTPF